MKDIYYQCGQLYGNFKLEDIEVKSYVYDKIISKNYKRTQDKQKYFMADIKNIALYNCFWNMLFKNTITIKNVENIVMVSNNGLENMQKEFLVLVQINCQNSIFFTQTANNLLSSLLNNAIGNIGYTTCFIDSKGDGKIVIQSAIRKLIYSDLKKVLVGGIYTNKKDEILSGLILLTSEYSIGCKKLNLNLINLIIENKHLGCVGAIYNIINHFEKI